MNFIDKDLIMSYSNPQDVLENIETETIVSNVSNLNFFNANDLKYTLKSLPDGNLVLTTNELFETNQSDDNNTYIICTTTLNDYDPSLSQSTFTHIESNENNPLTSKLFETSIVHDDNLPILSNIPEVPEQDIVLSCPTKNINDVDEGNVCSYCKQEFNSFRALKRHEINHLVDKPHKCNKCSASFNVESNLNLHKAIHSGEAKCPNCHKIFSRIASLRAHLILHEVDESFLCTECEYPFDTLLQLELHMQNHTKPKEAGKKIFMCRICRQTFSTNVKYKTHMQQFHKVRRFKVNRPPVESQKSKLKRIHQCSHCPRNFQKLSQLVRHDRIHTGEKPFKCSICQRAFSQNNTLKIHMITHTGDRPFKCPHCSAAFTQKGNLTIHLVRLHSSENGGIMLPCNECSCTFRKLSALNAHINRVHGNVEMNLQDVLNAIHSLNSTFDPLKINETHNRTNVQEEIVQESGNIVSNHTSSIKSIAIADCPEVGVLRRHSVKMRVAGRTRWHQCVFCTKEFKKPSDLIRHLRTHTKEKPYRCSICNRSFAVKSTLTSHLRVHNEIDKANQSAKKTTNFSCSKCKKKYRTLEQLELHTKRHDIDSVQNILPSIELEDPIFISDEGLLKPCISPRKQLLAEAGTELRPYVCSVCGAGFRKYSYLKQHKLIHTDERPYSCSICQKNFKSHYILSCHMTRTHTKNRLHKCKECSKSFKTAICLQRHMTQHSNKRPFMCPYCKKTFKAKWSCRKHMRIHKIEIALKINEDKSNPETSTTFPETINDVNDEILTDAIVSEEVETNLDNLISTEEIPTSPLANLNVKTISKDDNVIYEMDESLNRQLFGLISEEKNLVDMQFSNVITDEVSNNQLINTLVVAVNEESKTQNEVLSSSQPFTLIYSLRDSNDQANITEIQDVIWSNNEPLGSTCKLLGPLNTNFNTIQPVTESTDPAESLEQILKHQTMEKDDINVNSKTAKEKKKTSNSSKSQNTADAKSIKKAIAKSKNVCHYCKKSFYKPSDLIRHTRIHTGEKPFHCNICEKSFTLLSTLRSHTKVHNVNKTEVFCNVCEKGFSTKGSLKIHMRLHTGSKPFQCHYCDLRFRTSGHRQSHHQAHINEAVRKNVHPSETVTKTHNSCVGKIQKYFNSVKMEGIEENIPSGNNQSIQDDELILCDNELLRLNDNFSKYFIKTDFS